MGDPAYFALTSTKDLYLTLFNISGKDEGILIMPDKFSQDNAIRAGQQFVFPSDKDGYDCKFEDKGTETLMPCATQVAPRLMFNTIYTRKICT